jgi:hypothetical protein
VLFRDLLELNDGLSAQQRSIRAFQEAATNPAMASDRKKIELSMAGIEEDNGIVVYFQKARVQESDIFLPVYSCRAQDLHSH